MGIFRSLLGVYSYLFHGLFALFILGLAGVSLGAGANSVHLYIFPWEGEILVYSLLALGVLGLFLVVAAMKGVLPSLFFIWSLVVLALLIRGFFFSQYYFRQDTGELNTAVWIILAAVLAAIGASTQRQRVPSAQQ